MTRHFVRKAPYITVIVVFVGILTFSFSTACFAQIRNTSPASAKSSVVPAVENATAPMVSPLVGQDVFFPPARGYDSDPNVGVREFVAVADSNGDARMIKVSGSKAQPQVDSSCRTKTQAFVYGNTYVTQTVTVTAVVDMLENCDDQNFNPYFCQGTVNFYDYEGGQKTLLGAGSPVGGNNPCSRMFNINSLAAGTHVIDADFEGNPDYTRSSGRVTVEVDKWPTTTTLTSSPNPSTYGQDVTFMVTTSGGIEDPQFGTVKISNGTTALGMATLNGGVATFTAKKLAVGTNPITAEFLGDSQSAKSTSTVLDQVVNPAAP